MNRLQHLPEASGSNDAHKDERRIIYPVRPRDAWPRTAPDGEIVRRVCVLDCETTGLNAAKHQIIELCTAIVLVNKEGRIVGIETVMTGMVDPGHPLSSEIIELTGLTDSDLSGHSISSKQLIALLEYCDGVVAFNAQFDRVFVEKLIGSHVPVPWGCAMTDVRWRQLGFEPGQQGYLLAQAGYYMPCAHRAKDDVLALIELLDHVCNDGKSVMAKVLSALEAPAWRFEACGAPYPFKDELKERRYRWAPERAHKLWHKHVRPADFRSEYRWYRQTIGKRPVVVPLPAGERYRASGTWVPTVPKVTVPDFLR
ncbi:3'-5' exonuclease [Citromicrobium bathyomarinum]|uniref:3'-5' exonuclease n=1 Tax=Citromicrobium bathyomarinum TaxID=72174 RepID=UPI003159CB5D